MLNLVLSTIFLHSALLYNPSEESPLIGLTVKLVENDEFRQDFPFVGSMGDFSRLGVHRKFDNHYCGAALISKRHVLTAAHCLDPDSVYGTMVTFGSTHLDRGLSYEIKSWITYKSWAILHNRRHSDILHYDDIAVITLTSDVNGIEPAVISKLADEKIFGRKVVTIGWGYSNLEQTERPPILQKAYARVLNATDCETRVLQEFGPWITVHPNEYCTVANPPVILGCGDSGSPILLNRTKEIVGINSCVCDAQDSQHSTRSVSLHTKVKLYEMFINDVLNSQ